MITILSRDSRNIIDSLLRHLMLNKIDNRPNNSNMSMLEPKYEHNTEIVILKQKINDLHFILHNKLYKILSKQPKVLGINDD